MFGTLFWGTMALAVPLMLLAGIAKCIPLIGAHFARRLAGTRPKDIAFAGVILAAFGLFAVWNDARVSTQRWGLIEQALGLPAGLEMSRYRARSKSSLALPRGASHATLTDQQMADMLRAAATSAAGVPDITRFNGSPVESIAADALRWRSFDELKSDRAQLVPWMQLTADPVRMLVGSHIVCIAFVRLDGKTGGKPATDKRLHVKACSERGPREAFEFIVMAALVPGTRTLHVAVL